MNDVDLLVAKSIPQSLGKRIEVSSYLIIVHSTTLRWFAKNVFAH